MVRATGHPEQSFCLACFTGDYPIPVDPSVDKFIMERKRSRPNLLAEMMSTRSSLMLYANYLPTALLPNSADLHRL
jgi:hypothetical protein